MIERWITNDLTRKRWRYFKRRKLAVISCWILMLCSLFSFTAEYWANSKPIFLYFNKQIYFPVTFSYHPSLFGIENELVMNYRSLSFKDGDFALWPLIKWDPFESNQNVSSYPSAPSRDNILGTDDRGRDVLTRIIYGFRYGITFAILVWFLSMILGLAIGALMGYFGGKIDLFGQRLVEIWESVPYLLLLLTLIAALSPNIFLLIIFNTLFGWMLFSAYSRAEFLRLRRQSFVEAAIALGASRKRVIFRHVLPNALGPIFAFSPFVISANIMTLSNLDYLGFGLAPPTPSWGELLAQAKNHITTAWWLAFFASFAILLTLIFLNLIGEAVRDAFDPKKR